MKLSEQLYRLVGVSMAYGGAALVTALFAYTGLSALGRIIIFLFTGVWPHSFTDLTAYTSGNLLHYLRPLTYPLDSSAIGLNKIYWWALHDLDATLLGLMLVVIAIAILIGVAVAMRPLRPTPEPYAPQLTGPVPGNATVDASGNLKLERKAGWSWPSGEPR